jgi:hypothetical protein
MLADDLTQARGICIMNGRHARMISFEQRSVRSQLGAHSLIVFIHRDKFFSERFVQHVTYRHDQSERQSDQTLATGREALHGPLKVDAPETLHRNLHRLTYT